MCSGFLAFRIVNVFGLTIFWLESLQRALAASFNCPYSLLYRLNLDIGIYKPALGHATALLEMLYRCTLLYFKCAFSRISSISCAHEKPISLRLQEWLQRSRLAADQNRCLLAYLRRLTLPILHHL